MAAAVGSLWNPNSFHWEEKSYTQWAKAYITSLLTGFELALDAYVFKFSDVTTDGEASVSIRKGKSILAFDFKIEAQWKAMAKGEDKEEVKGLGSIKILDFSMDSVTDNDYEIYATAKTKESHVLKELLLRLGKPLLKEKLNGFKASMESMESNTKKLQEAKERVVVEKEKTVTAELLKGEEKRQIADSKKQEELEQRKLKEEMNASTNKGDSTIKGEGSVWNVNSFHWEEKPMSQWSMQTLEGLFNNARIPLLENTVVLRFFDAKVAGEASTTIRKGKKLIIFELSVSVDWNATCRDEKGVFLADANGHLTIPEFESEGLEDYKMQWKFDNHLACQDRLNKAVETEGQTKIKELLQTFVHLLEEKK